ncbi:NUDIX domain-containing protein [Kribbella sp. NPDC048928]|uniref:NUDIX domain-containing protein n=1 Tax=Kribbella sp. NPDC048928 TaxID=3364111 RepID=UPI003718074A
MPAAQHHFGVYARIRDGDRILLVHKVRGPYTGLLDLPGGTPEPGESWPQTLQRELHEELGLVLPVTSEFKPFSIHVHHSSTGEPIDFHHRGVFQDLPRLPSVCRPGPSADTGGAEWFNLHSGNRTRLSAAVAEVLTLAG